MKKITIKIDGKEIKAQVREEEINKLMTEQKWPKDGDYYWYISTLTGPKTSEGLWEDHSFDHSLLEVGNCYRTKEGAEAALRVQKLIAAVAKRRKGLNGDWVLDWGDCDWKYFIEYSYGSLSDNWEKSISTGNVFGYYKSRAGVSAIIDEFRGELLWYFTEYLPSIN